jgi:hypothetical protein
MATKNKCYIGSVVLYDKGKSYGGTTRQDN